MWLERLEGRLQQMQLAGPANSFGVGTAVEAHQDVADVHFDRTWAQEQLQGYFLIGSALRHQARDYYLPLREVARGEAALGNPAQAPIDLLAEIGQGTGDTGCQRSRTQPAGDPVGNSQWLHTSRTHAGSNQRGPCPQLRFGALKRGVKLTHQVKRLRGP